MPSDVVSTSILAGAIAIPFQGRQYEFVAEDSAVQVGLLAEATGILATVFMGPDLILEEAPVALGTANQIPIYPDHFVVAENVYAGTRLKVQLRNSSAGTILVKSIVRINPL